MIPERLLLIGASFASPGLSADAVLAAVARGLMRAGRPRPDLIPLADDTSAGASAMLDALGFDARMRASRAVVLAWELLEERMLAGSTLFEAATRARQAGVPAYAVTRKSRIDGFDTRILDLQAILIAADARSLARAGRGLALIAWPSSAP